jgi:hypothetical protein
MTKNCVQKAKKSKKTNKLNGKEDIVNRRTILLKSKNLKDRENCQNVQKHCREVNIDSNFLCVLYLA